MTAERKYFDDNETPNPSDEVLWRRFRSGDKPAFEFLFKKYHPLLHHFGVKFFYDHDVVDDCIQELFLSLWKKRETLPDVGTVKFYLITSLKRLLLRNVVILKRHADIASICDDAGVSSHEDQVVDEQMLKEQKDKLAHALGQLPPRQKEAVYLRFYEERSYDEITTIMRVNYQTARKFIYKGLQAIRKTLQHAL